MYGHPRAEWTFPEVERRRRLACLAIGAALGFAAGVVVALLG